MPALSQIKQLARNRAIIRARKSGATLKQVADEFGISAARVAQIECEIAGADARRCQLSNRAMNMILQFDSGTGFQVDRRAYDPDPRVVADVLPKIRESYPNARRSIAEIEEWLSTST